MPFWQRLLITAVAIVAISFIVGYIASAWLGFVLPSYISGLIGGIAALPVWEFLGRVRPKRDVQDY